MHRKKYNVRALRQELDYYARNGTWNKFRNKVTTLLVAAGDNDEDAAARDLLQAVVLSKMPKEKREGTLLHVVLKYYDKTKMKGRSSATDNSGLIIKTLQGLARAVPEALSTTDANLQTPLHVAIERHYPEHVVQVLLQEAALAKSSTSSPSAEDKNNNPLYIVDRQGDTPLLKAVKQLSQLTMYSYVDLLLLHDSNSKQSTLVTSRKRGRIALWYAAAHEARTCQNHADYVLSDEVQALLLATCEALLMQQRQNGHVEEKHNKSDYPSKQQATEATLAEDPSSSTCHLALTALVTCAPILEKHAVKLFALMISSQVYQTALLQEYGESPSWSDDGNLMHVLCRQTAVANTEQSWQSTNALLMEQLLRFVWSSKDEEATCDDENDNENDTTASIKRTLLSRLLSHQDQEGNLPIHWAARTHKDYIGTLFRAYPAALRHRNHAGQMPLHLAIQCCGSNISHHQAIVKEIWQSDPSAHSMNH